MKAVSGSLRPCFFGNNSFYASCNFTLVLWKEEFKLIRITKKTPIHIFYVFRERTTKTAGKCYSDSVGARVLQAVDNIPRKVLKMKLTNN